MLKSVPKIIHVCLLQLQGDSDYFVRRKGRLGSICKEKTLIAPTNRFLNQDVCVS